MMKAAQIRALGKGAEVLANKSTQFEAFFSGDMRVRIVDPVLQHWSYNTMTRAYTASATAGYKSRKGILVEVLDGETGNISYKEIMTLNHLRMPWAGKAELDAKRQARRDALDEEYAQRQTRSRTRDRLAELARRAFGIKAEGRPDNMDGPGYIEIPVPQFAAMAEFLHQQGWKYTPEA
jgi:hypothetical protein